MDDILFQRVDPDANLFNSIYDSLSVTDQSLYYSVDEFNGMYTDNSNCLRLCNYNIRSFNSNQEMFFSFMQTLKVTFNVIVLTETRFTNETGCPIEGYKGYHSFRSVSRGGGVSVYCDSGFTVQRIEQLSIVNDVIETCVTRISMNGRSIYIIAVYRPPGGSVHLFSESLLEILNDPHVRNQESLITGDFNVNLIEYENLGAAISNFVHSLFSLNFLAIITKPTRFPCGGQPGSPSLLDHIWYNRHSVTHSGIILFDQTDHLPTFIFLNDFSVSSCKLAEVRFRDHSVGNIRSFVRQCSDLRWSCLTDDVNVDTCRFVETVNNLYCRCFPLKVKYVSQKRLSKPWLSTAIMRSIKMKSRYFRSSKLGLISEAFYKRFRNLLNRVIRVAKKTHYRNAFQNCRGNLRDTWKLIGSLMKSSRPKSTSLSLNIEGSKVSEEVTVAEYFNDFFSSIASNLNRNIPPPTNDPSSNICHSTYRSIFMTPVIPSEIVDITLKLKNSSYGLHSIPTKIFKLAIDSLAYPLARIINKSINSGVFPDCLKSAIVLPIFKSGSELEVNNYRPISILPLCSKIFEKCVGVRLTRYLAKFDILSRFQYGFQKFKSTTDAVLNFVEYVYRELNNKNHVLGISIDLRKAFDVVCHDILLEKMRKYGIRGVVLSWFSSYLSNRTQCVRVGGTVSGSRPIICGVPQGSVLGPILFLLYINDLPLISKNAHFTLFADDTTISCSHSNYCELILNTNAQLNDLYNWTINNRLSLNTDKTSVILLTNRTQDIASPLILSINNCPIYCDSSFKFLGLKLDRCLNFSTHILYLCSKLSKIAGILYRIRDFTPYNILLKMYNSLVHPYLLYGILVWGDASQVHLNPIQVVQKKILRIITQSDYRAPSKPLFFAAKILKVHDLYKFTLGSYMFKLRLAGNIISPNHAYNTRSRHDATPNFQRLSQSQRSLTYNGPKYWNLIPSNIRNSQSLPVFKKLYKDFLLLNYES